MTGWILGFALGAWTSFFFDTAHAAGRRARRDLRRRRR